MCMWYRSVYVEINSKIEKCKVLSELYANTFWRDYVYKVVNVEGRGSYACSSLPLVELGW